MVRTVAAWNYTNRGQAICGSSSGNWAARTDDRLLTGARYEIQGSNLIVPGRNVLAWWWNVKQGGNFPRPYIDGAAFYEDTLNQVGGSQGRPLMWNSSTCFLYPSVAANKRGDLGVVFNYSAGSALTPAVGFAIADDYVAAPPGFLSSTCAPAAPGRRTTSGATTTRSAASTRRRTRGWPARTTSPGGSNCANCSRRCSSTSAAPRSQLVGLLAEQVARNAAMV